MVIQSENSSKRKRNNSTKKPVLSNRGSHIIRLPIRSSEHLLALNDRKNYVTFLQKFIEKYPMLFPDEIAEGFGVHDSRNSSKLELKYYRIKLKKNNAIYSIYPCDVLPYMMGKTKDVEIALLLLKYAVPYWLITKCLGRYDAYWERVFLHFGRCSIVGSTVKDVSKMPKNITADEKITWLNGKEIYASMIVGCNCILGNTLSLTECQKGLQEAYGQFKAEAQDLVAEYMPESCNIDGWQSSTKALRNLFPKTIFILCFLHSVLKIRKVCGKEPQKKDLLTKVWNVYKSKNIKELDANVLDLQTWTADNVVKTSVKENVAKLCERKDRFAAAFAAPNGHRTTSMVDRVMRPFDKFLANRMYFHGHLSTAQLACTAFALCHNFAPFAPRTRNFNKEHTNCRADNLNGFSFRENWLENLLVATSRNGFQSFHQK